MDRAYEANPSSNAPAAPNPALLGYPAEGASPTTPGAWWFYMITEELRALIVAAGIAPDATQVNQVAAAVSALIQAAASTGAVANTLAKRDGSGNLTAAGFNVSSDSRLKDDITPITGALDRLDMYRGVTYRRKGSGQLYGGVVAQDFARARPEGVRADEKGLLRVDVMAVTAELVEALREEREARRALEARLAKLEGAGR